MKTRIVMVKNPLLKAYLQYFIFFNHDGKVDFNYITYPNTNLCLALYKQNNTIFINYKTENKCIISSAKNPYSSRLIGFHTRPFNVEVKSTLDQVCILFNPAGLSAFSTIPFKDLVNNSQAFDQLFNDSYFLEQLFSTTCIEDKCELLETFFLKHLLIHRTNSRVKAVLKIIYSTEGEIKISTLASLMAVDKSTLYRNFIAEVGQSPKDFLQTVRFRNALTGIINSQHTHLSRLSVEMSFFDQSHFIKDFKKRTGELPHTFQKQIKVEQAKLVWITMEK
jgi:AraC-like DNA-binding protein